MSQRTRGNDVGTSDDEVERRRISAGHAPLLRRPDEETAASSGWIRLDYEAGPDDVDETTLSDLSDAEARRRLNAIDD